MASFPLTPTERRSASHGSSGEPPPIAGVFCWQRPGEAKDRLIQPGRMHSNNGLQARQSLVVGPTSIPIRARWGSASILGLMQSIESRMASSRLGQSVLSYWWGWQQVAIRRYTRWEVAWGAVHGHGSLLQEHSPCAVAMGMCSIRMDH